MIVLKFWKIKYMCGFLLNVFFVLLFKIGLVRGYFFMFDFYIFKMVIIMEKCFKIVEDVILVFFLF